MIRCICIDDSQKPRKIPESKWVKKGEEYTVVFVTVVLPQKELAFLLDEMELDESCAPYEYYLGNRFAFKDDDFDKLIEFVHECSGVNLSVKELLNQTNIIHEGTANSI